MQACPTDVVNAPPERVWELLTNPAQYESWADAKPIDTLARSVAVGDRVILRTGPGRMFKVVFEFLKLDRPHELTLDVRLPFGVVNHEVVRISRLDGEQCRVTFN